MRSVPGSGNDRVSSLLDGSDAAEPLSLPLPVLTSHRQRAANLLLRYNLKLTTQANILGTRSDHYAKLSRLDDEMHASIPQSQIIRPKRKAHSLRLASFQVHALKTTQILFIGRHATDKIARIELHYFITFPRPCVLHVKANNDIVRRKISLTRWPCFERLCRIDLQITINERRVAQPVSEIVKRAVDARLLTFPLGLWLGRKIERNLPDGSRKRNSQFTAWIVIPEQDIGDRCSALRAGKPSFNNAGHVLIDPIDAHRPAINQNHDNRFSGRVDCLDQIELMAGQIETGARCALADRPHRIAQNHHREV